MIKSRTIFLDIDGVLNSTRYWSENGNNLPMGQAGAIDPAAVAQLNRIWQSVVHPNVILSSSWRCMGWQAVDAMLKERGFVGFLNGCTCPMNADMDRWGEIEHWLRDHKYACQWERFVVIDDSPDAWSRGQSWETWGRFISTNYLVGLTAEGADLAIDWLRQDNPR